MRGIVTRDRELRAPGLEQFTTPLAATSRQTHGGAFTARSFTEHHALSYARLAPTGATGRPRSERR
jgi:hypothetical protein